jgi:cell division septation protein DedD
MKIKILYPTVCLLLMITAMVGCSQAPHSEEQQANQTVGEPITALPSAEPEKKVAPAEPVADNMFVVQVATFRDVARAEKLVEALKKESFQGYISPGDLERKGRWYRVLVGDFKTKDEAAAQLPKLKEKFGDCFVRRR